MDQATQEMLVRRVLKHLDARTTDLDPEMVESRVERYLDPAQFARERQAIFGSMPLAVAHVSALAEPNAFITRDVAGRSVLLTRNADGNLRGFHNVCRHRGTQLVAATCGRRQAFACPYHAWTYNNDGRLLKVRHEYGFAPNVQDTRNLAEVSVCEAGGLVWVQLDAAPIDIDSHIGDVLPDLHALRVASHTTYRPRTMHKQLGWKLGLDIFLEGYHVNFAHRHTIAPMFLDNINLFDRFEPHMRAVLPKRSIAKLASCAPSTWALRDHANVLYLLFPNTLLLVQPDHIGVFHIYPDTLATCRIEAYTLLPEQPEGVKARRYWDKNLEILYGALDEDFALGESIQAGLASGANTSVLFGRFEQSLAWFHDSVDRRTASVAVAAE